MSFLNTSNLYRPRTAAEAKELMHLAIEQGDFENAKILAREVESLENFEEELALAKTVHGYYQKKQKLSDKMDHNYRGFGQQVEHARANAQAFYQGEFLALKKHQEAELETLLEKWDTMRLEATSTAEQEFEQTMTTAKLLASRMNFDEAIKIKTAAELKLQNQTKGKTRYIDAKFNRQAKMLLDRQQNEINMLAERRSAEMRIFDALQEANRTEALESFLRGNAQEVLSIATRFPPDSAIPKALQMQTVRGKPVAPKSTVIEPIPDNAYMKRMDTVDKTISFPLKAGIGRANTEMRERSSFSLNDSTEIMEMSLTRSPPRSPVRE